MDLPAWEFHAWMSYYSVEPWDLPNQLIRSFVNRKVSSATKIQDPDLALQVWASKHNARLLAEQTKRGEK